VLADFHAVHVQALKRLDTVKERDLTDSQRKWLEGDTLEKIIAAIPVSIIPSIVRRLKLAAEGEVNAMFGPINPHARNDAHLSNGRHVAGRGHQGAFGKLGIPVMLDYESWGASWG